MKLVLKLFIANKSNLFFYFVLRFNRKLLYILQVCSNITTSPSWKFDRR